MPGQKQPEHRALQRHLRAGDSRSEVRTIGSSAIGVAPVTL